MDTNQSRLREVHGPQEGCERQHALRSVRSSLLARRPADREDRFITAFLAFYLASITLLVLQRKREGRPWSLAVLGLGRDAASEKTPQPWVGRIKSWAPASAEAELEDVRVDEGPKKEGDLSAWR